MIIQKRVYQYREQKNKAHQRISRIADISNFKVQWVDENTFILKHKNPLVFFALEGDIAETEGKGKLKVFVTTDVTFLMFYILPAGLILLGLLKWSKDSEMGILLAFTGISLSILISLISSAVVGNLKKAFKEALNIN
ncbi:MAG: hypothetical protein JJE22_13140 [Bacteroidia bacterium]|nr:hypothetical protein [Bacteroidia bacterium]